MISSAKDGILTIEKFISQVGQLKSAADGGTPISEPGSIGGETSHPSKKVDDRLETVTEGARFKENTKDVKDDQGAPSIENAAEAKAGHGAHSIFDTAARFAKGANGQQNHAAQKRADSAVLPPGSAADDHLQIGTKVSPTGEDPKSETESAKAGKIDPGSTHPARTDNDKIDGHKWSYDQNTPLNELAALMKEAGDDLCAQLAWHSQQQGANGTAAAAQQLSGRAPSPGQQKQAAIDPWLARQAGWELAGLLNGTFDKQAADSLVQNTLYDIIKTASDDADNFIEYMNQFLAKSAEEMPMPPPEAGGGMGGPPPGAGGTPPEAGGNEAAMMAALGGGGGAPGGMPPEAGGMPPEAGGMPPEAGGAPGGDPDQQAQQLAKILEQLGITPEELQAALSQEQGGGGGEPPDAGGPPPGGGGPPPDMGGGGGMETQASDRRRQWRQPAQQKQAQTNKLAGMQEYITELITRSRARR